MIPMKDVWGKSPLHSIEHALAPYVLYLIVPIFAFANAGVVLSGLSPADFIAPVPLGIALGLIVGKQLGVFGLTYLLVKFRWAQLPHTANWMHIYGLSCLAGIGFTMSLFIGGLGVLSGSLVSAVVGYGVLMLAGSRIEQAAAAA
jgi:NhaA family Na+:H+ antiporter